MTMSSRRNPAESSASRARGNIVWGWFFSAVGGVSLLCFLYAAIISKFLPPAKSPMLAAIHNDRYYCYLVPLTLPILVICVYFHWISMKLFKHA